MKVYIVKTFFNLYGDEFEADCCVEEMHLGAYTKLESAIGRVREFIEDPYDSLKIHKRDILYTAEEVATAAKVCVGHRITIVQGDKYDAEIVIQKLEVSEE